MADGTARRREFWPDAGSPGSTPSVEAADGTAGEDLSGTAALREELDTARRDAEALRAGAREREDAIEFLWPARVEEAVEKHRQLQRVIIQVRDENAILEKQNMKLEKDAMLRTPRDAVAIA